MTTTIQIRHSHAPAFRKQKPETDVSVSFLELTKEDGKVICLPIGEGYVEKLIEFGVPVAQS